MFNHQPDSVELTVKTPDWPLVQPAVHGPGWPPTASVDAKYGAAHALVAR